MKTHIFFVSLIVLLAAAFIAMSATQIALLHIWGAFAIAMGLVIIFLTFSRETKSITAKTYSKSKQAIAKAKERRQPDPGPVQKRKPWL